MMIMLIPLILISYDVEGQHIPESKQIPFDLVRQGVIATQAAKAKTLRQPLLPSTQTHLVQHDGAHEVIVTVQRRQPELVGQGMADAELRLDNVLADLVDL
jgi:hypothetical protein